jgi:hypothetical protein
MNRQPNSGSFRPGNPGGPGRPKRGPELPYLEAVKSVVTLEEWRAVLERALADAKIGNARAREWLGKLLVGDDPLGLLELAADVEELENMIREPKQCA